MNFRDLGRIPSLRRDVCERVNIFGNNVSRLAKPTGRYFFCPDYQRHELRLRWSSGPVGNLTFDFPGRFREDGTGISYRVRDVRGSETENGRLTLNFDDLGYMTVAHHVNGTNYLIDISRR